MLVRGYVWVARGMGLSGVLGVVAYIRFIGALLSRLSGSRQTEITKRGTIRRLSVGYVASYRFVCAGPRFV